MDRTIMIAVPASIPHGHRIQVTETADDLGERTVVAVTDLETQIHYRHSAQTSSAASTWTGHVLECTIASTRQGFSTTLLVDPISPGTAESDVALRGADAAAEAAKDEALRWGGGDRLPEQEPPRFW